MKTVAIIDMVCETYIPSNGQERSDWLITRPTDPRAISRMYNNLVHATDFLPWAYLDSCREALVALWMKNHVDTPMLEFLNLISCENGKSCAWLNEEQRAYVELKLQHAIMEMADACHFAVEDDEDCPTQHLGDVSEPSCSEKEVVYDVE